MGLRQCTSAGWVCFFAMPASSVEAEVKPARANWEVRAASEGERRGRGEMMWILEELGGGGE